MGEILCVERAWCERVLMGGDPLPSRFIRQSTPHETLVRLVNDSHGLWLPREDVEEDERFKQIVVYTVVRSIGPDDILTYRRAKAGGEGRLHGRISCGVGGHVERPDLEGGKIRSGTFAIRRAAYRELREELSWPSEMPFLSLEGFVNDESDAVGRVHLGVVFVAQAFCRAEAFSPSLDVADLAFTGYKGIVHGECESWTRMILEADLLGSAHHG